MPDPFSGSASGCARTVIRAPNSGVRTSVPNSARYRSSSGCATSATHAGISSGRVVSITTSPPPSTFGNRTAWYAPGMSRSSSSACATAVRKSTSQSVGASAWYASPRARLRRNARCATRRAPSPIVVYVMVQSTERPARRHNSSNARSSSTVRRSHSSTKFRREIATGGFLSGRLRSGVPGVRPRLRSVSAGGSSGGSNDGSYGSEGSQRTP